MAFPYSGKLLGIVMLLAALSLPLFSPPVETQEPPAATSAPAAQGSQGYSTALPGSWRALLEQSQREKRGLTVQGHSIGGIVTHIHGDEAVEVRNQTHQRLIIRLDRIDALGIN